MSLRLAIVSTYPPRRCGLAAFAAGLYKGLRAAGASEVAVVPVVRDAQEVPAGPEVLLPIRQDAAADYRRAAAALNGWADAVLLQHEYGIFGGPDGAHVLHLLAGLKRPLVTTLHTVLGQPSPGQRAMLQELAERSAALVVMGRTAAQRLREIYGVPAGKVHVIPHGVPPFPPGTREEWRRRLDLDGVVAMTFGLLGPGKGIEVALQAMARAVRAVPELRYLVVGSTHPEIRRREGEAYREQLQERARRLGLADRVRFVDRYLDEEELLGYLQAIDLYVVPYPNREQVSSGTLTFAMAAGKAVISTPFPYARDMLADGAGVLVPHHDAAALARALVALARYPGRRALLGVRARARTQGYAWPDVARRYLDLTRHLLQPAPVAARADVAAVHPAVVVG